jgi:2-amino-4-hydroxy-6-hydroxymethyldihydropteridine diphosphokinase
MTTGKQKDASAKTQVATLLLALGGNTRGRWGGPVESMLRACRALEAAGLRMTHTSSLYLTEPVGGHQPPYLNAVIMVSGAHAACSLLRLLKQIERQAGRRVRPRLQARPLDIDILDYGGRRLAWPFVPRPSCRREPGRLILPHPLLHLRAFVLVPLLEIAPHWRHPVFGRQPKALLARLGPKARGGVGQALDFPGWPCEKTAPLKPRSGTTVPGRFGRAAPNFKRGIVAWRA